MIRQIRFLKGECGWVNFPDGAIKPGAVKGNEVINVLSCRVCVCVCVCLCLYDCIYVCVKSLSANCRFDKQSINPKSLIVRLS